MGGRVLITGGGTSEFIDPVRVITNLSSGKMGKALQQAFAQASYDVTYLNAAGLTAEQLGDLVFESAEQMDIIMMAAAVSDYRPLQSSAEKLKSKEAELTLKLTKTIDILAALGQQKRPGQYLAGFALESNNLLENARVKLQNKNLDLIVVNGIDALQAAESRVTLLDRAGNLEELPLLSKEQVAERIVAKIRRDTGQ